MQIGYARVSTNDQTPAIQIEQLRAAGCTKIFSEKESGATTDRKELRRMLKAIGEGDTVIVCRLDRLARSTRDLLNILEDIKKAGATFKSIADAWADTTTAHGKLLLTVLGGLAEFERELIMARTNEGRRRAIAAGKKMGPKFKLTPAQRAEALRRREAGETVTALAESYNVSHSTIVRLKAAA